MRISWLLAVLPLLGCDVVGRPARGRTKVTFASATAVADNSPVNFTVTVRDAEGDLVDNAVVTWAVEGEGATVDGSGVTTDKTGEVSGALRSTKVGEKTLNVTITGEGVTIKLAPEKVTFIPGPPSAIRFIEQPTTTKAGIAISPAVVLEVLDANENRATEGAYGAWLRLVRSSGGVVQNGGTAQMMVSAVDGLITFDNLIINKPQTGYALRAQTTPDNSGAADESAQFDVQLGDFASTTSTISAMPTLVTDGGVSTLNLTARDHGGNPLAGVQVFFSVSPASGCFFVSNVSTTDSNGVISPPIYLNCTEYGGKQVTGAVGDAGVSVYVGFQ